MKLTTRRMPSGAGHDAQMMQRLCPTAMIFVPSVAGLSHNVKEHTEAADLLAGAQVLANLMLELASEELGDSICLPRSSMSGPSSRPAR